MAINSIRRTGRNAQGVRLINLGEGEQLAGLALIADTEEEEEEGEQTDLPQ